MKNSHFNLISKHAKLKRNLKTPSLMWWMLSLEFEIFPLSGPVNLSRRRHEDLKRGGGQSLLSATAVVIPPAHVI